MKNNQLRMITKRDQNLCGNTYEKNQGHAAVNIHHENKRLHL